MSVIPTVAELQQQLAQAAAAIDDLNRRGAIEQQANLAAQAALAVQQQANLAAQAALAIAQEKLAARRVAQPKIPLPRIFDGKTGTGIVTWIDEIERQFPHFEEYFATDAIKITQALNFVIATVRTEFKQTATTAEEAGAPIDTWDKFVAVMTKRYQPVESAYTARSQLDTATQSGSAQAYVSHFLSLMTYINDMSASDQVQQFCRGLKQAIRVEVMKTKPKTLTDTINSAVGFEVYTRQVGAPASSNSSSSSLYRPHQQRSSYHAASSSAMDLNNVESQSEASPYLDVSPSRESHLLAVIQQQQENQAQMQQQLNALLTRGQDRRSNSSSSSGDKIPGITREVYQRCRAEGVCLKCKEKGHNASACTKPLRLNW